MTRESRDRTGKSAAGAWHRPEDSENQPILTVPY